MELGNYKRLRFFKDGGLEIYEDDFKYLKSNEAIYISKGNFH